MFFLLGVQIFLISTPFPTYTIITDLEEDEFLFDFHVHTTMSDGWLSPEERVDWYIEQGIHGAAFSDHDNLRGAKIAQDYVKENDLDFVVFTAEEWTDHENDIHMNIFGLEEKVVPEESESDFYDMKSMNAKETIKTLLVPLLVTVCCNVACVSPLTLRLDAASNSICSAGGGGGGGAA